MRKYLSLKQIADALSIRETYAGQAIEPALDKIARLYNYDNMATLRMILDRAEELRQEEEAKRAESRDSMSESELHSLTLMQTGRLDRKVLHPNGRR